MSPNIELVEVGPSQNRPLSSGWLPGMGLTYGQDTAKVSDRKGMAKIFLPSQHRSPTIAVPKAKFPSPGGLQLTKSALGFLTNSNLHSQGAIPLQTIERATDDGWDHHQ